MCELYLSHICFVVDTLSRECHWRVFKAKKKKKPQHYCTDHLRFQQLTKTPGGSFLVITPNVGHSKGANISSWCHVQVMSRFALWDDLILILALWRGWWEDVAEWNNTYQIQPFCLFSHLLKVENKTALVRDPLAPSRDKSTKPVSAHLNKSLPTYLRIHHVQWVELILALDKVTTGLFCLLALVNRTVDTKSESQMFTKCVTFCHSPNVSALSQVWTIALHKEAENGSGEQFLS